ncbi:39S ribosomal protein S30, mitochondrial [Gallus gallus]|uniref:p52 pro-apototic protein n=1 Tax=Gallus gallus TaxID=9031 RepID=O42270_CHICK|nr:large ribosomal subunit protein mL65 [Gallus gallus]AAC60367.1 p52 pro-apototic protein [Gallus gallus]|eukprot:NP_990270.1 39S ribosomal protein S30, mitochondrial [Gallus gallus]
MAACRGWRLLWHGRCWFSQDPTAPLPTPASVPLYPPIVASHTAKSKAAKRRRLELFYQQVHEAATIEEKLRLYGKLQRPKYMVYPQTFALNADRWYRSFTKTVFVPGLPPRAPAAAAAKAPEPVAGAAEALEQGTAAAGAAASGAAETVEPGAAAPGAAAATETPVEAAAELDLGALRDLACDALLQESYYQNKKRPFLYRDQDHTPAPFLTQLVSSLAAFLCKRNPLLAASSMDLNPEVNYYWHHGEEVVVHGHRKGRVDPVRFQIDDKPHLQIRVPKQLPEIVPLESDLGDVPVVDHKPSKLPLFKKQYENKVFIGSKVADPCCYGHTQFHLIPDKLKRQRFIIANLEDQIEVVYRANGIASLFAWTAAQAMYQGFWNEADVTRPFVSQAVVTDGKYFAFFCYQLNTLALTAETIQKSSRKNICWGTDSKPLYDVVEDGSVRGFNDEVLLQLVGFLLNRPKEL